MTSERFEDIVADFEFLEDWEDRYRYVIDLGRKTSPLDPALKVAATKVDGCASQVWLVPKVSGSGPESVMHFDGESDAMIVQGLIAVLHALYGGLSAAEVAAVDAPAEFARLGLDQHLSSQRSNGLRSMVARIREFAAAAAADAA